MTDKQIIIDGCNVSGCEFYWKEKELCNNGNLTSDCQENKDCLYKRYMRKEQECERLKEDLRKSFEEKDILHLIIDRLLEASGYDTNTASAEDFEDVYEHMRYEQQQLDQLKQTLTEIKEIVFPKNQLIITDSPIILKIQEKISECEVGDA